MHRQPVTPLPRGLPLTTTFFGGGVGSAQPETQTPADYMSDQTDINDKMRAILIDWLVEVHLKFKLMPETLFLTTNLIDRFLAKEPVSRKNLQVYPRCRYAPCHPRPLSHPPGWVASPPARGRTSGTSRLRRWLREGAVWCAHRLSQPVACSIVEATAYREAGAFLSR